MEEEENAHFITNFFYTHTPVHTLLSEVTTFELDTHPNHSRKDGFCMTSGYVQEMLDVQPW
jgi:hypothetical protein